MTVTLPERILKGLEAMDPDRSRAIVKCVEAAGRQSGLLAKPVELIELTPGKALIVVGPCSRLRRIPWLRLVELVPFRFLLVLPPGTAVEVLEVALQDLLLNEAPDSPDGILLKELLTVIRKQRRGRTLSTAELLFVDVPRNGARKEA